MDIERDYCCHRIRRCSASSALLSESAWSLVIAILIAWAMSLSSRAAWALDPAKAITQYSHSSWQGLEGLPQDTVRAVAQTEDGYLWIGTEAGLARFDGVRLDVFNRRSNPDIFESSHIYALATAPDGTLWIGTLGGGLNQLKDGPFTTISVAEGLVSELPSSFFEDPDGSLRIPSRTHGLDRLREGHIETLTVEDGLTSNNLWGGCCEIKRAVFGSPPAGTAWIDCMRARGNISEPKTAWPGTPYSSWPKIDKDTSGSAPTRG